MVFDEALLERFEMEPINSDTTINDIYKRLEKSSYDVFLFSCEGHRVAVKMESFLDKSETNEVRFLGSVGKDLEPYLNNYTYDFPKYMSITVSAETYEQLNKLQPAYSKKDKFEPKDRFHYHGISYDFSITDNISKEVIRPSGSGVGRFESNNEIEGVSFQIVYQGQIYQVQFGDNSVFWPHIMSLQNFKFDDIFGPLMIPRIIAWGDLRDIDLAREHLNFDAVMAEQTEASITAIAGRLRRWDDSDGTDEALKMLLETDFAQQYFTEIVNAAESALPEDVVADLKMMITEKSLSGVAVQSKRKLSRI